MNTTTNKETVKTPQELVTKMNKLNETLKTKGENVFINELPEEIFRLTSFIANEPLFKLGPKELEKELYTSIETYVEQIKKGMKNQNGFIKQNEKVWKKWEKIQKKQKKLGESPEHQDKRQKLEDKKKKFVVTASDHLPQDSIISSCSSIDKLLEYLNETVIRLGELLASINLWITLRKPRIDDGNNFVLSVQEEYSTRISALEVALRMIMDSISEYYSKRGNYIQQIIDEPEVRDYKVVLLQYDEWTVQKCKFQIMECRNSLAILFDSMRKNMNWLCNPKMESDVQHIFI